MYIPQSFLMTDQGHITALIQDNSFATLIHINDGEPVVSHVPLYLDQERHTLIGHLAKNNPHSNLLNNSAAYVIFHGPHDYISTLNHTSTQGVPTWNYATIHIKGTCIVLTEDQLITQRIAELLGQYEKTELQLERFNQLKNAIIFFEIQMDQVEAKFKLSQNRPIEDQKRTILDLKDRNPVLANMMQDVLFNNTSAEDQTL
jgi:transcriptional regulator